MPSTPSAPLELRADPAATAVFVVGLVLTAFSLGGETPVDVASRAAVGVGLSLALLLFLELRRSFNNLLRADLVALVALYFLLFFEFLFPQPDFNELVRYQEEIVKGATACLWGFGGLAAGRHLLGGARLERWRVVELSLPPRTLVWIFWIMFLGGYLNMLAAVDFDPVTMVRYFFEPRFELPWGRDRFGDWKALLFELGAVLYLVPPLAGVILGKWRLHSRPSLVLVGLGLLFTLLYGFSTGTRNLIASYIITFLVSFYYASGARLNRTMVILSLLALTVLLTSTFYAIRFRNMGLKNFLTNQEVAMETSEASLFVDFNLFVVSRLTTIFPRERDFAGLEVPMWALVRPIPRALWPGKPDGLNISAETALGEEQATFSSTFIGESYMSAGVFGVVVAGLFLGFVLQWWAIKAYSMNADFGVLIYGSGFFAVVITMRSLYMILPALMPTFAILVLGNWLVRRRAARSVPRRPASPQTDPQPG